MKIFSHLALAAASILAAAGSAAAETRSFTQDGIRFKAQETVQDGVRLITGSDSTGAEFSFRVRGSRVTGTYRGNAMSFDMPAHKPQKVAAR